MNRKKVHYKGKIILFGVVGFVIVLFYLWGKVQINLVLQKNDNLKRRERALQLEIDDLRSQIDAMKSYKRIVELAQKQGLIPLSPSRVAELQVDMKGIELPSDNKFKLRYAGFASLKLKRKKQASK